MRKAGEARGVEGQSAYQKNWRKARDSKARQRAIEDQLNRRPER